MKLNIIAAALAALVCIGSTVHAASTANEASGDPSKPDIVLVHGAFADASSWDSVISILQAKGYHVVAVNNPLSSLADDVAATNRVIDQQTGPIVLVGHSWAGEVITQAGNSSKVAALVYVASVAPDSGQSQNDLTAGYPAPPWASSLIKDEGGFLTMPADDIARYFAQDLPPTEQKVIAATQGPWFGGCLDDKVTQAAWHDKPSWWVIPQNDRMIDPRLQEALAAKIGATVTKVNTSHVAMIADPKDVAAVIMAAAQKVQSGE